MSEKLKRFTDLMQEIFELDKSDLDFGIYRIMNIRKTEIEKFLNDRLPELVQKTLEPFAHGNKEEIRAEMTQIEKSASDMGMTVDDLPETAPSKQKYIQLRKQLAEGTDLSALETDVYSALYSFFNRYYEEGDFISKRRYKEGVYAIPYEGEEVKLYWANQDQYYIKTSENFKDYSFTVADHTVHFRLVDATTEQNNNKESKDKKRVFMLFTEDEENYPGIKTFEYNEDAKEFIIRFIYDIPEDKKKKYDELNYTAISEWLLKTRIPIWQELLVRNIPSGKKGKMIDLLEKHLKGYVAKNTFDYFIHKDLRGFLSRELDFYIKSEVMHLDDLDTDHEERVETYLAKVKAIKRVGKIIIDFLAQIEDFQKKLWLKKKFVVETNWCMTLDKVDESFWQEIIENKEQINEWIALYAIDEAEGWTTPPSVDFLCQNQNLSIDTKHFDTVFKERLVASIENLDEQTNGLMVYGDNYHSIKLLNNKYINCVKCIYIDPPFNTGNDDFCYKDGYLHSSWATMMYDRLLEAKRLLAEDATVYTQIDYYEKERLKLILDELFIYQTEIIWRIGWLSGYKTKAKKFIRNHDTIYQYSINKDPLFNKTYIPYPKDYVRRDGNPPEGEGYPIEDTWNCYEIDKLDSIQIISFSKEKVGDATATQKPEALLERMIISSTNIHDYVMDFFAGTGTTMAAAYKTKRRFIISEMDNHQFYDNEIPRAKRILYGDKYGISEKYNYPKGGIIKYITLENYEDALSNIQLDDDTHGMLGLFSDDYMIHYMLDLESQGSLLNLDAFRDPFSYRMKITEKNECKERPVDVIETFNYLIGLTVIHQGATVSFTTKANNDGEYEGAVDLVKDAFGQYSFRQIEGTLPDGRRALVIWRTVSDNIIESNCY